MLGLFFVFQFQGKDIHIKYASASRIRDSVQFVTFTADLLDNECAFSVLH